MARVEKKDLSTSMPVLIHCFLQLDCGYNGIQCDRTLSGSCCLDFQEMMDWNLEPNRELQ